MIGAGVIVLIINYELIDNDENILSYPVPVGPEGISARIAPFIIAGLSGTARRH